MPRKREVVHRAILPDPKHHSPLVAKFVNSLMRQGKKSTAESILYRSLDLIAKKTEEADQDIRKGHQQCQAGDRG